MPDWLTTFQHDLQQNWGSQAFSTGALILSVIGLRWALRRWVRHSIKANADMQRRWIVQVRNVLLIVLVAGLLVIWGPQLRSVAIGALAFVAALVIATKELIMCISGTVLEGSGRCFSIGDRIEVAGVRGDVFDQTLLTTTILEVGPGHQTHQYTGRTITVPNSLFLSNAIVNETSTDEFVLHLFTVPARVGEDLDRLEGALLAAAQAETSGYLSEAKKHMERIGSERGLKSLSVEPRVTVQLPEPGRVNLVVRIPAPARRRGQIEQAILRRVMPELTRVGVGEPKD